MACRTETKPIGEIEYSVTQWPAEKSMLMKFRLAKVFGATITSIVANLPDSKKNTDQDDAKALSEGFSKMFESNSPEEIVSLMKQCVVGVARDGTRITDTSFNELFSGDDLIEVYKIFMFVLQVNYGNLLKGQLAERLLARAKVNL
jgi:hypothetical protein